MKKREKKMERKNEGVDTKTQNKAQTGKSEDKINKIEDKEADIGE